MHAPPGRDRMVVPVTLRRCSGWPWACRRVARRSGCLPAIEDGRDEVAWSLCLTPPAATISASRIACTARQG